MERQEKISDCWYRVVLFGYLCDLHKLLVLVRFKYRAYTGAGTPVYQLEQ
jgi:hypothetical protein